MPADDDEPNYSYKAKPRWREAIITTNGPSESDEFWASDVCLTEGSVIFETGGYVIFRPLRDIDSIHGRA